MMVREMLDPDTVPGGLPQTGEPRELVVSSET